MPLTPTGTVGANIRAELARQRKSQTALAHHLGVSQTVVSFRLRGETPIDVNELVEIARFLGVTIETLTQGAGLEVAS